MLGHPRVVGRGLQREVERDLQAELAAAAHEARRSRERAQVGVDRVVPAVGGADRPRRARVVRAGGRGCCSGPCGTSADRVDRRQVDDVEAHAARRAARRSAAVRERARDRRRPARRSSTRAPSERGKNSYHDPYSARCRSTCRAAPRRPGDQSLAAPGPGIAVVAGVLGRRAEPLPGAGRCRAERDLRRRAAGRPGRLAPAGCGTAAAPARTAAALVEHQLHVLAGVDLRWPHRGATSRWVAPCLDVEASTGPRPVGG